MQTRPFSPYRFLRAAAVLWLSVVGAAAAPAVLGADGDIKHPDWFKASFFDLPADLEEARESGKTGILLFFHTPSCSYCKALLNTTFSEQDVVKQLRSEFDVIALDVLSDAEVTGLDGRRYWAKEFAVHEQARFTPTLVFYGGEQVPLLRLVGYYPPDKFRAVLDYLGQRRYESQSLRAFVAERNGKQAADQRARDGHPRDPLFARPPYVLDRRLGSSDRPLLVLFDKAGCDSCARFHRVALRSPNVRELLSRFEAVQLDMNDAKTGLITPSGAKITARQWADSLGLVHAPALLFFDERGKEVLRVDSQLLIDSQGMAVEQGNPEFVANVAARLRYVLEKGYLDQPQFQQWRGRQGRTAGH